MTLLAASLTASSIAAYAFIIQITANGAHELAHAMKFTEIAGDFDFGVRNLLRFHLKGHAGQVVGQVVRSGKGAHHLADAFHQGLRFRVPRIAGEKCFETFDSKNSPAALRASVMPSEKKKNVSGIEKYGDLLICFAFLHAQRKIIAMEYFVTSGATVPVKDTGVTAIDQVQANLFISRRA